MNNIENITENIPAVIDAITLNIPVRVTMTSIDNAPFEFTPSIDELGQIILTPATKDVEFVDANTVVTTEAGEELLNKETTTTVENDSSSYLFTTKETTIVIQASMLAESDNHDVTADVDEIGQVVLSPLAKENTFVSAAIGESLNLVIEESVEVPSQESEDITNITDVEAEVITEEEQISNTPEQIQTVVEGLTNKYEDIDGTLEIDDICEANICLNLLKPYYDVTIDLTENTILLNYVKKPALEEDISNEHEALDRATLIKKFMQGELTLFSDTGTPLEEYIHLQELDSNNYEYYYDEESGAVVSYPARGE